MPRETASPDPKPVAALGAACLIILLVGFLSTPTRARSPGALQLFPPPAPRQLLCTAGARAPRAPELWRQREPGLARQTRLCRMRAGERHLGIWCQPVWPWRGPTFPHGGSCGILPGRRGSTPRPVVLKPVGKTDLQPHAHDLRRKKLLYRNPKLGGSAPVRSSSRVFTTTIIISIIIVLKNKSTAIRTFHPAPSLQTLLKFGGMVIERFAEKSGTENSKYREGSWAAAAPPPPARLLALPKPPRARGALALRRSSAHGS